MKIGYLVHNLNDPAVERRCVMLDRGGASVRLAGFCRDDEVNIATAARRPLLLGRSEDAAMLRRAAATVQAAFFSATLRDYLVDCDVILARNLEQLAIARAVAGDRPLIYECLDIHRSLVGTSLSARMVQAVETMLLPRVDLLLTSSPAFVDMHFAKKRLRAPIELIENKLLIEDGADWVALPAGPALPITIGWFGMLRCRKTLQFLTDLVLQADGRVNVLISGKPSSAELPHLAEQVAEVPGMRFTGPYRYADLPALYGQCHFAWTIDWFEEGLNSSWLLPNRLYEAISHGTVPIALADVQVGRWLAAHDCGLLVDVPEDTKSRLKAMDPDAIAAMQLQIARIDRKHLVADQGDCRALVSLFEGCLR